MTQPIGNVGTLQNLTVPKTMSELGGQVSDGGSVSFQNLLLDSLGQVNSLQGASQAAIEQSLAGGDITQVEVFLAVKKADLALRMMLQMRNKAMEAFEEIKQLRM